MSTRTKISIAVLVILLAAASRLVKHPFNFTPVAAMALFAGCYLGKKWGVFLPLAAMAASDIFLYAFRYGWPMFDWKTTLAVYLSISLAFVIGWFLKNRKKWYNVGLSALISSIVFFLITNFAVWLFFDWYPHTLAGLLNCFTLALPFFRNTLAGDLVYTGVLFSAFELVLFWSAKKAVAKELA